MTTSPAAIVRAVDHIFPEENTEGLAVLPSRGLINGSKLPPDNPSLLMEQQVETPFYSFVIFLDLTAEAKCVFASDSVSDLLGWIPSELIGESFLHWVHPEEISAFSNLHYEHVEKDLAATLTFLRLRLKPNPDVPRRDEDDDGYVLCAFSRSVARNVIVGSISLATSDPGNARAATATGGVFVITPTEHHRSFRRWNMREDLATRDIYTGSPNDYSTSIDDLPKPSKRVAILLDRFKQNAIVLHCSNKCIIPPELVFQEDLLRFIPLQSDKDALNSAVTVVKTWGPQFNGGANGIFAFCRFILENPTTPSQEMEFDGIVSGTSDAIIVTLVLRQ